MCACARACLHVCSSLFVSCTSARIVGYCAQCCRCVTCTQQLTIFIKQVNHYALHTMLLCSQALVFCSVFAPLRGQWSLKRRVQNAHNDNALQYLAILYYKRDVPSTLTWGEECDVFCNAIWQCEERLVRKRLAAAHRATLSACNRVEHLLFVSVISITRRMRCHKLLVSIIRTSVRVFAGQRVYIMAR